MVLLMIGVLAVGLYVGFLLGFIIVILCTMAGRSDAQPLVLPKEEQTEEKSYAI